MIKKTANKNHQSIYTSNQRSKHIPNGKIKCRWHNRYHARPPACVATIEWIARDDVESGVSAVARYRIQIRHNFCAELMLVYEPLFEAISSNDSWNGASFRSQTTHINVHRIRTVSIQRNERERERKNSSPNLIMTNLWNLHQVIHCMATHRKKTSNCHGKSIMIC